MINEELKLKTKNKRGNPSIDNGGFEMRMKKCGVLESFERNNYFFGKLLTAKDFEDEQNYFVNKQRLINRLLHGVGVVCGLEISKATKAGCILLSEGFALDRFGREIIVPNEMVLDLNSKYQVEDVGKKRKLYVYVSYFENKTKAVPAVTSTVESTGQDQTMPSRILESFKVDIDWTLPDLNTSDKIILSIITLATKQNQIIIQTIDNSAILNSVPLRRRVPNNQERFELMRTKQKNTKYG